jgi:ribosome biogenesis GTPase
MAKKKGRGRKIRVDFRQNRGARQRTDEWTRRYHADQTNLDDAKRGETVRAKGELSRRRTIIVDENEVTLVDAQLWRRGIVTSIHGQICHVDDGDGNAWDCTVRRVLRTLLIEQRSAVTVGDLVWFAAIEDRGEGERIAVIERVEERSSLLSRGARIGHDQRRGGHRRQHLIAANVDQLVIIGSAAQPNFKPHLVDRYLVAAAKGNLRPVICINKCDLLDTPEPDDEQHVSPPAEAIESEEDEFVEADDEEFDDFAGHTLHEILDEYRALGYCVLLTSVPRGDGLEELRAELKDRTSVFSGQSGVGKSSLLNALQPGLELTVAAVSEENEKGRHTTTHARLLRLDFGGYVVDTPGIRSFDLWEVEPGELEAYFVELAPYLSKCRFNDCHHRGEQGCAVREAADAGEITARRYASYLKMLDEIRRM